jgi:hypothetical protein
MGVLAIKANVSNLDQLGGLERIDESLAVDSVFGLDDFRAFVSLEQIGGLMVNNTGMKTLRGLEAITTTGDILFRDNPSLAMIADRGSNLGLSSLQTATRVFAFCNNQLTQAAFNNFVSGITVSNSAHFSPVCDGDN